MIYAFAESRGMQCPNCGKGKLKDHTFYACTTGEPIEGRMCPLCSWSETFVVMTTEEAANGRCV